MSNLDLTGVLFQGEFYRSPEDVEREKERINDPVSSLSTKELESIKKVGENLNFKLRFLTTILRTDYLLREEQIMIRKRILELLEQ